MGALERLKTWNRRRTCTEESPCSDDIDGDPVHKDSFEMPRKPDRTLADHHAVGDFCSSGVITLEDPYRAFKFFSTTVAHCIIPAGATVVNISHSRKYRTDMLYIDTIYETGDELGVVSLGETCYCDTAKYSGHTYKMHEMYEADLCRNTDIECGANGIYVYANERRAKLHV